MATPSVARIALAEREREVDSVARRLRGSPYRPCADCRKPCRCSASPTCACACTVACPEAPERLSSDPAQHPIESLILPLVLVLAKTGCFAPCWSCEGHRRPDGAVLRPPSVWFACECMAAVGVIDRAVQDLGDDRALATRWRVRALSFPGAVVSSFALEPDLDLAAVPDLGRLQADARILAERLPAALAKATVSLGSDLRTALPAR